MEFVLDNGLIRVALSTAGGSFTSIAANGREYLCGVTRRSGRARHPFASRSAAAFVTVAQ